MAVNGRKWPKMAPKQSHPHIRKFGVCGRLKGASRQLSGKPDVGLDGLVVALLVVIVVVITVRAAQAAQRVNLVARTIFESHS
jgi:hypothetical protein